MKMYLNIIRNNLEVRNYPTVRCICKFDSRQVPGGNANLKINRNIAVFAWLENIGVVKFDVENSMNVLTTFGRDMYYTRLSTGCIHVLGEYPFV